MKWMITNADVLNPDGKILKNQDMIIEDNLISEMGEGISDEHPGAEKTVDASGKLVIPGLINTHLHSHDRFDKGRFDNLPLEVWMAAYNPPNGQRDWTVEEIYLRTLLNGIEMIRCGTTTVVDDVIHTDLKSREKIDAVFQAYSDAGIRAKVSISYADKRYVDMIPFLDEFLPDSTKQELIRNQQTTEDDVLNLWREYAERWHGRVAFALSPSGPQRSTDGFLKKTCALSREFDLPVVIHVLESKVQELTGYLFYGKSLVEHMQAIDILDERTCLVHCVWVNDRDIELIARANASVLHNPVSNLKLGSGIAPVRKMLNAGVNVSLGTDNNNANDSVNIFETMKIGALINKVTDSDYHAWVGAADVFKMATQGGAKSAGLSEEVGELSTGKKADFVLLNPNTLPFLPYRNALHQLVFCEHGESIEMVVVDGKPVFAEGKVLTVDESDLIAKVQSRAETIMEKIDRSAARASELVPYVEKAYAKCMHLSQVRGIGLR